MRRVITALLLAGALATTACGGSKDSEAIKAYKKIVDETCACKDAACAEAADKKEQDWRMENFKGLSKDDKGAMKDARQKFTKCRDDLKAK